MTVPPAATNLRMAPASASDMAATRLQTRTLYLPSMSSPPAICAPVTTLYWKPQSSSSLNHATRFLPADWHLLSRLLDRRGQVPPCVTTSMAQVAWTDGWE